MLILNSWKIYIPRVYFSDLENFSEKHTENWFELFGAVFSVGQGLIKGYLCIHIPLSYFTSINHFGRSSLNWFRSNGTGCLLAIFCGRSGHCRWQENPRSSKGGGQKFVPSSHPLYSDELWHTFLYSLIKWEIFKILEYTGIMMMYCIVGWSINCITHD